MNRFNDYVGQCRAKQKVVILDCCHSGAPAEKSGEDTRAEYTFLLVDIPQARGVLRLSSCASDERSFEHDELGHGVFSYYLIEAMKGLADSPPDGNDDRFVTADEVFEYTSKYVFDYVRDKFQKRQKPQKNESDVEGPIVLAVRPSRGDVKPEHLLLKIERMFDEGHPWPKVLSVARKWKELIDSQNTAQQMPARFFSLGAMFELLLKDPEKASGAWSVIEPTTVEFERFYFQTIKAQ